MCRSVRGFQWLQAKNGKIQLQKKNQVKKGAVHKRSLERTNRKKKSKKSYFILTKYLGAGEDSRVGNQDA